MRTPPRIGISIGNLNGIAPEVILKTFADQHMYDMCTPVVYASYELMDYYRKNLGVEVKIRRAITDADIPSTSTPAVEVVDVWADSPRIQWGKYNPLHRSYVEASLRATLQDTIEGKVDAMVTGPIDKNDLTDSTSGQCIGHTEYIADRIQQEPLMLMTSEAIKVALATIHCPVSAIHQELTKERLLSRLRIFAQTLQRDFAIQRPRIAVLGLNPHAGDGGIIGNEEKTIITPVIQALQNEDMLVYGPLPADGYFGAEMYKDFDGTMAMYHDQGLVPFKLLSFGGGVNVTAGLSIIRTSPDHGTAMSIAGSGTASESSFREAIYAAIDIHHARGQDQ